MSALEHCHRCDDLTDEPVCPHMPLCADCYERGWCQECETELAEARADLEWRYQRENGPRP